MDTGPAFYVGIDVAKDSLSAAAAPATMAPANWRSLKARTFANDEKGVGEFVAWLRGLGGAVACLCAEATGVYSWRLAKNLAAAAGESLPALSIVNPRWPKGTALSLGVREKTDAADAAILAVHALLHKPAPTPLRADAIEEFHELARTREAIVGQATATKNRIGTARTDVVREELQRLLASLEESLARIDKEIDARIAREQALATDFKLLDSVPGIGRLLAIAILAEYGDLRLWSRGQLASYAGLFPKAHESGTSVHAKPRLAKNANPRVRARLYLAAVASVSPRGIFRGDHKAFVARGKAKMQSIGAVMRKLLILARAVVVSGKAFDPAKYRAVQNAVSA